MPQQTTPNANNALGGLLRRMMPDSRVLSENSQTSPPQTGCHADVLINVRPLPVDTSELGCEEDAA